ncbi:hypothetical protein HanXRQr2_Chr03g0130051 [Helianthus annuus]|uniref:Uncharacterized protein n=1 Tax=Helianthus annuus TaxID=4232 RepID=A0A251VBX3_HELAN|nr:hypothetical protein HanXRQr2_Chr10g0442561 [Helianthus annuus]KAF5816049.1 hypothetical protein HanXRQr2_Chr03g0130051 [Helianthus annuus]
MFSEMLIFWLLLEVVLSVSYFSLMIFFFDVDLKFTIHLKVVGLPSLVDLMFICWLKICDEKGCCNRISICYIICFDVFF